MPRGNQVAADSELASRLRIAVMRMARRLRQHAAQGDVSASMLSALVSVERYGPVTLGELAEIERVRPPTMTRVVARLEVGGTVVRTTDPDDRRVNRIALTRAGKRYLARNRGRKNAYLVRLMQGLKDDEVRTLEEAVVVIEKLLEETS